MKNKENILPTKDELDKLTVEELVGKFSHIILIIVEGYNGENEWGFIPSYINRRVRDELEILPYSYHNCNTWDTYTLYELPPMDNETNLHHSQRAKRAIKITDIATAKGMRLSMKVVKYEAVLLVEHHAV